MRTEAGTRLGTVRLDGVPFIHQVLIEQALEQIPHGLHVFGLVGDVGIFHVHPITHVAGKVVPHIGVLHNRLAAGIVIFLNGELYANVFFCNAEFLFHSKLYR